MDTRNDKVIAPPEYENNEIKIPISQNAKRSSMFVGICADGTCINALMENGYAPDKISITYKENGFYDINAFIQWVYEQYYNYQGEALIILDGFGPHDYDDLKLFFSLSLEKNRSNFNYRCFFSDFNIFI